MPSSDAFKDEICLFPVCFLFLLCSVIRDSKQQSVNPGLLAKRLVFCVSSLQGSVGFHPLRFYSVLEIKN